MKITLPKSTKDVKVPKTIIEQIIGQEKAVEIVRRAAPQRRHVFLIGKPGTGKSMLAQGMSELMPAGDLEDILVFPNPENDNQPLVKEFPAGFGRSIVHQFREKARAVSAFRKTIISGLMVAVAIITFYYTFILRVPQALFSGIIAAAFLLIIGQ